MLEDRVAPVEDADERSAAEREINRQWAAISRLGDRSAFDAESLIRSYLRHRDPTLRGIALFVLAGRWQLEDLLQTCPDIATDDGEHPIVRAAAVDALSQAGRASHPEIAKLLAWLSQPNLHPPVVCAAATNALKTP